MILELPMDRETRIANRDFSFTFIGRLMDSLYSNEREREKKKERKKSWITIHHARDTIKILLSYNPSIGFSVNNFEPTTWPIVFARTRRCNVSDRSPLNALTFYRTWVCVCACAYLFVPRPEELASVATRELYENEKRLVKLEILGIRINRREYNTYRARTMENRGSFPLVMTVHRPLYIARTSLKNTRYPSSSPSPLFKASHFVFALYFRIYVYAFYRSRLSPRSLVELPPLSHFAARRTHEV